MRRREENAREGIVRENRGNRKDAKTGESKIQDIQKGESGEE